MKRLIAFALIAFIVSICLFSYKQKIFASTEINAERFSHFATFVSAIFSFITVLFIYYTFQQTQQTQQIAAKTLKETQKNSLDSTFFSLIQSHQNTVNRLHQRITLPLKLEHLAARQRIGDNDPYQDHKDFFELMYAILDAFYKDNNTARDKTKIAEYFKNQDWVMGHYFRSLEYFINWVETNLELIDDTKAKEFYIGFIQSQLTSDELRLFFYYVLSKDNNTQKQEICKVLKKYSFFNSAKDTLIFQGQNGDWEYFLSITS